MSSEGPRMGKGLGALFGTTAAAPAADAVDGTTSLADVVAPSHTLLVSVDSIEPNPRQPRQSMPAASLDSLAKSVREHGIIQPLIVILRPGTGDAGPRYQIIAGQRRWEAAKLARLKSVPVVVKHATPQQMLEMALIENLQREDLNPIEAARAYQMLMDEYGLTQEEVAQRVGYDRSTVANFVSLLRLPDEVQQMLMAGMDSFTMGHAKALIGIPEATDQIKLMQQIIAQNMTVRAAEEAAKRMKEAAIRLVSDRKGKSHSSAELDRLAEEFQQAISFRVAIKRNAQGRGSVTIEFNNEEELNRLYDLLVVRGTDEEF